MKNRIFLFASLAALLCLAACQKEEDPINETSQDEEMVTITFTAEKADMDTRTAIKAEDETSVSYIWTSNDLNNLHLYMVTTSGLTENLEEVTIVNRVISSDRSLLQFAATVPSTKVFTTYTFRAILSKTMDGTKPCVTATQSPLEECYDTSADVLISDDMAVIVGSGTTQTSNLLMTFHRPVVINKMTLKNLVPGETIKTVEITSDKYLIGHIAATVSPTDYESYTLTLNCGNGLTVSDTGELPIYFVSLPISETSLTVTATNTDGTTYTKSFAEGKTIDFKKGYFTRFNVAFPNTISISSVDYVASTDTYTINYTVSPASGLKVNASADVDWITDIDNSTAGVVTFKATGQDYYSNTSQTFPEAVVTLSLSAATSKTVRLTRANDNAVFRYYFDTIEWKGDLEITTTDLNSPRTYTFDTFNDSDLLRIYWNDVDYYWPSTNSYISYNGALDGDDYRGVELAYSGSDERVRMGAVSKYCFTNISEVGINAGREYGSEDQSYIYLRLSLPDENAVEGTITGYIADEVATDESTAAALTWAYGEVFKPGTDTRVQKYYGFSTGKVNDYVKDFAKVSFEASCRSGSIYVYYVDVVADGYIIIED